MKNRIALIATVGCLLVSATVPAAAADIEVKDAWARATVPGQKAGGAFMTVTSAKGGTLVGASSPVAKAVEIHEMKMDGGVMKMRAVPAIELPAGKAVRMDGDYHVMLMGLTKELKAGERVPLTLQVKQQGKVESVKVEAEVRAVNARPADAHEHH